MPQENYKWSPKIVTAESDEKRDERITPNNGIAVASFFDSVAKQLIIIIVNAVCKILGRFSKLRESRMWMQIWSRDHKST